MSEYSSTPPTQPHSGHTAMRPHRGGTVLALGILGIVLCQICGIIAWVMGNSDLRDMRAGLMDPSGEGLTNAGRICGIVSVVLLIIGVGIGIVAMMGGLLAAGTAVSSGG